jgi:hypothetical protein
MIKTSYYQASGQQRITMARPQARRSTTNSGPCFSTHSGLSCARALGFQGNMTGASRNFKISSSTFSRSLLHSTIRTRKRRGSRVSGATTIRHLQDPESDVFTRHITNVVQAIQRYEIVVLGISSERIFCLLWPFASRTVFATTRTSYLPFEGPVPLTLSAPRTPLLNAADSLLLFKRGVVNLPFSPLGRRSSRSWDKSVNLGYACNGVRITWLSKHNPLTSTFSSASLC